MGNMADYLETMTADYTAEELTISPQNTMEEEGQKKQYFHKFDDGDLEVITASGSYFDVTIQWDWMSLSDAVTLLDFYHNALKANGRKRTFYWLHPVDNHTYVVRFMSDLTQTDEVEKPGAKVIPAIKLKVIGVKA